MNEYIDVKEMEKKAWKSTFQDGLWDIYFGLIIAGIGFSWLGGFFGLPETVNVLVTVFSWDIGAMLIFFLGKKYITRPRMGFVKFGQIRKKRNKFLALFMGLMVALTFITFIFTLLGMFQLQLPEFLVMLLIGLLFITVPFSVLAYFLQLKRLCLYALLGGLGLFISELLLPIFGAPYHEIIPFGGIGLVITITGLIIFIKFLKRYSLKEDEGLN
ncbi:MAG: hypothetical protein KGD68_01895 [Candidatus Lokiarchaeota archaeon]|nr:hypothetical protein [Candidatus Lokiarchaeota archaeon]